MRPDQSDDVLREIRAELMAVKPSPAFAAGVRARVERRTGTGFMWLSTAAVAIIVAAVGLGVAKWSPGSDSLEERTTVSVAGVAAPVAVERSSPRVPVQASRTATAVAVAVGPRLEVIVPPDQAIAVRRLLLMHGAGRRFAVSADGHAVDEETGALVEQTGIQIPLITIAPLPGPEPGIGGKGK